MRLAETLCLLFCGSFSVGPKKTAEEVHGVEEEGRAAIDGNSQHPVFDTSPEDYVLAEGEERSMIEPGMINNHDYQELLKILINWINDELRCERRALARAVLMHYIVPMQ